MTPHVIHLRGPWQLEALARTLLRADGLKEEEPASLPAPGRCRVPSDWAETLGADFCGRVRYTRNFGCPTGLEPLDRVDLTIERIDAFGRAWLNREPLGEIAFGRENVRFDVTALLKPRNVLTIEVEMPRTDGNSPPLTRPGREGQPGGLIGEVALEIFAGA
jgi:hypothetical protein